MRRTFRILSLHPAQIDPSAVLPTTEDMAPLMTFFAQQSFSRPSSTAPLDHQDSTPLRFFTSPTGKPQIQIGRTPDSPFTDRTLDVLANIPPSVPLSPDLEKTNAVHYLSNAEKNKPELKLISEDAILKFLGDYTEYCRATGSHRLSSMNDLITLDARKGFRVKSTVDVTVFSSDAE
jgi:hypothetical protein